MSDVAFVDAGKRNLLVLSNDPVGSGPPKAKIDDEIVLVAGVPLPMVLRRNDDGTGTRTLIGPAFIYQVL
jgi:hypothetical protein